MSWIGHRTRGEVGIENEVGSFTDSDLAQLHRGGGVVLRAAFEIDRLQVAFDVLAELVEVARLRGDNELPHPTDDPELRTARMQDAWHEADRVTDIE